MLGSQVSIKDDLFVLWIHALILVSCWHKRNPFEKKQTKLVISSEGLIFVMGLATLSQSIASKTAFCELKQIGLSFVLGIV